VQQALDDLFAALRRMRVGREPVVLTFFEGDLVVDDRVLTEESVLFDQLIRDVSALGVDSIEIQPDVTHDEIATAVGILAADATDVGAAGGIERMISAADLTTIRFGRVVVPEVDAGWVSDGELARQTYENAVGLVREVDNVLQAGRQISSASVRAAVSGLVDGVLQQRGELLQLTAMRDYDEYTFYHSVNVAILALGLGSTISREPRFLTALGTGALLHDVGKLVVDRDLLNKPGKLTPEEWQTMREHPVAGARIVSGIPGIDRSAAVIVLEHHMAYNGSGYPQPRHARDAQQHLASRIVAVADAYDAMTSRRAYSEARPQTEAMRLIAENAGDTLDPVLARLFIGMLGVYPPRSVVRLDDGRLAVVVRPGEANPGRPLVRVIATPEGELIEPYEFDLALEEAPAISQYLEPDTLNIEVDHYL
jgi:HD-GYP domain-containing protein (c-di-GMP phosphodiesterase class II)